MTVTDNESESHKGTQQNNLLLWSLRFRKYTQKDSIYLGTKAKLMCRLVTALNLGKECHSLQNENKHQIRTVHTKCNATLSVVQWFIYSMNETQQAIKLEMMK